MSTLEQIEKDTHPEYDVAKMWLINRVKKLESALRLACYRHHTNCDKECVHICPVKIMREALEHG